MVEASLIILHRNPFYLLSFFFFILLQILVKTSIAIRPTYRSDYSAPTICICCTRVAISATSLSSRFIEWKNCKAFSDPSENRSACSLYSWHYMYLKIPLFICIRKFSILAVISEFQSSTKVAKKKYIPLIVYSFASI